ncbi:MAG: hypothetical protein ABJA18_06015 [bacterium]
MITGFNTDIEHEGVVYHVQTEDKGVESPLLLSLVYVGGAILAAKRSRYEDLIAAGFDEDVLTKRLKRQHQLICAAIRAGRIGELKRMGARTIEDLSDETTLSDDEAAPEKDIRRDTAPVDAAFASQPSQHAGGEEWADPRRQAPESEGFEPVSGLSLTILDEEEYRAGEPFTIRIMLMDRSGKREKAIVGADVSVKILGTAFRPQMYSVKTERGGIAVIANTMPIFTSGRAAVLARAVVKGETIEARRVIHPAD